MVLVGIGIGLSFHLPTNQAGNNGTIGSDLESVEQTTPRLTLRLCVKRCM